LPTKPDQTMPSRPKSARWIVPVASKPMR
jgi:hypothetical protein